jgi:hypothetical protein
MSTMSPEELAAKYGLGGDDDPSEVDIPSDLEHDGSTEAAVAVEPKVEDNGNGSATIQRSPQSLLLAELPDPDSLPDGYLDRLEEIKRSENRLEALFREHGVDPVNELLRWYHAKDDEGYFVLTPTRRIAILEKLLEYAYSKKRPEDASLTMKTGDINIYITNFDGTEEEKVETRKKNVVDEGVIDV